MSRKYKFKDNEKPHFISFATVHWIDVFTRNEYRDEVLASIRHCQEKKGLLVYAWCLMPSHMHMIIGSQGNPLDGIMRDMKSFTSRRLRQLITDNVQESRREWMLRMMQQSGLRNSNNNGWQLWQQDSHPIELRDWPMTRQKLDYVHDNPVAAGFVDDAAAWLYSSARDYSGIKGLLDIELLE
jgi:REP element-mobilizing transposase RayT